MKFKVGNRVKSKEFGKGIVVETETGSMHNSILVKFDKKNSKLHNGNGCSKKIYPDNTCWFYNKSNEQDLKIIKQKQFTKSDLQDGDIVTYRNGDKRMKTGERIQKEIFFNNLKNYNENLTILSKQKEYDIVKVERPIKYETVFERKEEILDEAEKRYLSGVIRPWRDKIGYIKKYQNTSKEYIYIELKQEAGMSLPNFKKGIMYDGMKAGKHYTLEELRTIKESDY